MQKYCNGCKQANKQNQSTSQQKTIISDTDTQLLQHNVINVDTLTQSERNSLFRYNYYFNIYTWYLNDEDNAVYYKIRFGKSTDYFINRYADFSAIVNVRFSTLRSFNICIDSFPPRTILRRTSTRFIENRLQALRLWTAEVLVANKQKELFEKLRNCL